MLAALRPHERVLVLLRLLGSEAKVELARSAIEAVQGIAVLATLDWLDIVHPAAVPMRAEPVATRRGEMVEQVRHRAVRTMSGDQFVARKRGSPVALAACGEYGLALFVGEPVERWLNG